MSSTAASSSMLAGEPFLGGVVEDGAADGEALDDRRVGAGGEGRLELVLRRFEAEEDDAAAPAGRCASIAALDSPPGRGARAAARASTSPA